MNKFLFTSYWLLFKHMAKLSIQLPYGVWKLAHLSQPIVTVMGGSRVAPDTPYARLAHELAHQLTDRGISVITGGGPGIMEAVSCGATHLEQENMRARTVGITVKGLLEHEPINVCAPEFVVVETFAARKWLMMNYSIAFAFFPGGFGTLEELAEVATLMQTKNLPGVPIVLLGKDYWTPLIGWLRDYALREGLITKEGFEMLHLTDDIDEAVRLLIDRCQKCTAL
jgi:hypothetical protein